MRIGTGVPVSGKVLGDGDDTRRGQAASIGCCLSTNAAGRFAEGAGADDGVVGVGVDVSNGREVDVDAQEAAFVTDDLADTVGEVLVASGTEDEVGGVLGDAGYSSPNAVFGVYADEQRDVGGLLVAVSEQCLTGGCALEEDEASRVV